MAYGGSKTTPADKDSFLWMIDLLNEWQIDYWVEGGWGIDILLENKLESTEISTLILTLPLRQN